jgi:S1-C subfamily serine protease
MAALQEMEEALKTVAERAGPSVVGIGHRWAHGSGAVISEGKVLTNAHNVRGHEVSVVFADGRTADGEVAAIDPDGDLAVVSVDTGDAPPLDWAGEDSEVGTPVFALANPGGRGPRVTLGFISGTQRAFRGPRGRQIAGSVEHTAPLARGSSGGPIVDHQGRLLGLNTNRIGEGFYLAIPADEALRGRVDALSRGESATRPRLGVAIAPPYVARRMRRAVGLPERDGLLVRAVEDGTPAGEAGIARGDLIVEVDGHGVQSADDLFEAMDAAGPEGSVTLKVVRGAEERSISVSLGAARPAGEQAEA